MGSIMYFDYRSTVSEGAGRWTRNAFRKQCPPELGRRFRSPRHTDAWICPSQHCSIGSDQGKWSENLGCPRLQQKEAGFDATGGKQEDAEG